MVLYAQADSHVENPGDPGYDVNNANGTANWLAIIEAADTAGVPLLNLGDLAQTGYNVEEAGGYVNTIDQAVCVLGNHDVNPAIQPVSAQKAACLAAYGMPANYYALDVSFVRLLVLDSTYDANGDDTSSLTGHLTAAQLDWLENELSAARHRAVLILVHHPPIAGRFGEGDIAALETLLAGRCNVWVLAGHVHPSTIWERVVGPSIVWVLAPTVNGKYARVTVQKMSNGLARVLIDEQTI